jgi:type IV pilus assembly protein PilE
MMLAARIRRQSGVTLLELMIVVIIVGIMAAVAYPNCRDFVDRAKRNEAKALLLEIAQNQERFYLQNSTYGTLAQLGYTTPLYTDSGTYQVTVAGPDASNFDAQADYLKGGNEEGKCKTFNIDGRGTQTSAPYDDCWTRTR